MVEVSKEKSVWKTKEFYIRPATIEDAPALVKHMEEVLKDRMASLADLDEMILDTWSERDHLRRIETNPLAIALVAVHEQEIIGLITCEGGRRRKTAHVAEIGMSVKEKWRRKGVGSALLERAEEWARSTGKIRKLALNVFEHNHAAISLYQKHGFVVEGRLAGQINLDGELQDLLLMAKYL